MRGKVQEPIDSGGSLARAAKEIVVPSSPVQDDQITSEITSIDHANGHSNGRDKISGQSTGPRTELGKQRSSQNAIRHGIFSEAILLKGESRAEFESLRMGLREALQPEGRLEELLLDKLAALSWRYRRLLVAETGEIRNQLLEWSEKRDQKIDRAVDSLQDEDHLISEIQDPDVLRRCLELLAELRQDIEKNGFQQKRDNSILEKLYGNNQYSRDRLRDDYAMWFDTAQLSEEERAREDYATPDDCKQNVLDGIRDEVRRLRALHKRHTHFQFQQNEIEIARRSIPDAPWLDRVLRYEASVERAFDRTLAQLERLQRLRRGQPVAPRVDVTISGEIPT